MRGKGRGRVFIRGEGVSRRGEGLEEVSRRGQGVHVEGEWVGVPLTNERGTLSRRERESVE